MGRDNTQGKACPPMVTPDKSLFVQLVDVPPYGLGHHLEIRGKLLNGYIPQGLNPLDNSGLSFLHFINPKS